jgi:hypothetical protein
MATAGGNAYGAQLFGGTYEKFANDGSFTALTGQVASYQDYLGMWGDPANGDIISASEQGLIEINPTTGAVRVINASLFPDGVSVSLDGTTAYIENGGNIQAVRIADGAILNTYSGNGHSPDGTGVISGGKFSGILSSTIMTGQSDLSTPPPQPKASLPPAARVATLRRQTRSPETCFCRNTSWLTLSAADRDARLAA